MTAEEILPLSPGTPAYVLFEHALLRTRRSAADFLGDLLTLMLGTRAHVWWAGEDDQVRVWEVAVPDDGESPRRLQELTRCHFKAKVERGGPLGDRVIYAIRVDRRGVVL